jgi:hypothetical protein
MIAERSETVIRRPIPLPPLPLPLPRRPLVDAPISRPMGHRGSRVVRKVRVLGWRSPETLAVLLASFLVSLAALYISAYARVAMEGFDESRLYRQIRVAKQDEDALHAQISALTLASTVQNRAVLMNMVANRPEMTELLSPSDPAVTESALVGGPALGAASAGAVALANAAPLRSGRKIIP